MADRQDENPYARQFPEKLQRERPAGSQVRDTRSGVYSHEAEQLPQATESARVPLAFMDLARDPHIQTEHLQPPTTQAQNVPVVTTTASTGTPTPLATSTPAVHQDVESSQTA